MNGAGPGYLTVKRVSSRSSEIMHVYFVNEGNNLIYQGVKKIHIDVVPLCIKIFFFFKFLTACEPNFFGKNCAFECHCPDNDTCSNINGLCSSGNCHEEYGGPGCQRRTSITLL